jgi:cystathionine beta-lyase/cystathionine gamma-synthase
MAEKPAGAGPSLGRTIPLVPPLYQTSVYTVPDLDTYDRIVNGEEPGFFYARDSHPNARHLAEQIARVEAAAWAAVCASGMAAISATILSLVQQGDRIVASGSLYGRTTILFKQELPRFGVQTSFVDAANLDAVCDALAQPAKLLFVETMSNPLVRLVGIEALAKICHERQCVLVVDNTFATPALVKPLELGAAFVVESLTKMIGGHSDVTLGAVAGARVVAESGDAATQKAQIDSLISTWGFASNPFDCWLAARGLATLALRMQAASANAAKLADWLANQPGVTRLVYPGRADHPDHELARRMLRHGFGNMMCFELAGGREAVNRFMYLATGIPFSPSLGHITTTCSHPAVTSHRYVSPAERKRQGITDGLIRLSVGVEDLATIQEEMAKGLSDR